MKNSPRKEKKKPEAARKKPGEARETPEATRPDVRRAVLAAGAAWLFPGAGHFVLRRWSRGAVFFVLVFLNLGLGCWLQGRLPWVWSGSPLTILATLGCMGNGFPYFILRFVLDYEGDIRAAGFDYGNAFILTAGLMNLLLVLDAWDIGLGRKR